MAELPRNIQANLNGVSYESLPETTIAVNRRSEKQQFQKNDYTSSVNEAICDFNTGAKFLNTRRSALLFSVVLDAGNAGFGHGSVCNLIRRVVLTTRSGTELSRTEDFNLLSAKKLRYECSRDYIENFGQSMGLSNVEADLGLDSEQLSTTKKYFLIPLTHLSPFFEGDGKSLVPPQLAAGLRLQITLENDTRALVSADTPSYTVSDIAVLTNVTQMVDSWTSEINEESSKEGLTYTYPEWHTTQAALPSNQTSINIEVRKAVARSLLAFSVTKTAVDGYGVDNMKSDAYDYTSVEWKLGSMYPTQQPIKTASEAYFLAQSTFDSGLMDCKDNNSVSLDSFTNYTVPGASTGTDDGDSICAVSLERSDIKINQVLNISGLPQNNSSSLSVDITAVGVGSPRTTYLFLKHLRMCKAFLDNVSISE